MGWSKCCPEGSEFHIVKSSIPLSSCDDADAQFNLGVMYYKGRGVPQNYLQAHVWANLAASSARSGDGHPSASSRPRRNFDNSGALNRQEPSAILPDGGRTATDRRLGAARHALSRLPNAHAGSSVE